MVWRKFWVFVALAALLALPAWADGMGTLTVIKQLTPGSPAPATPWEFTVTRVDVDPETLIGKFYLPPTGGQFSLQVQSGSSYRIAETLKPGYDCLVKVDPSDAFEDESEDSNYHTITITVTAKTEVTFTNEAQPATLTVEKTVIGTKPAQTDSWTFTVKKGTEVYAVLSILGDGGAVTLNIPKEETNKTYTIIETTKEGYLCTVDGQATNQKSILLAPGDNKTVEFVNMKTPVTITVVKEVLGPAPEEDWKFEVVGQLYSFNFTLPPEGGQTQLLVPAGTYTITETVQTGYFCTVDNVQTRSCRVTVWQNESKTVTFVNTAYATIKVVKVVQGQTPSEPWVFTLKTDDTVQTFSIDAWGGTFEKMVEPGTYTIIETPKPNYVCTVDGQITNEVTITVGPGKVKTVTFVNTRGANTQANTFGAGWNLLSGPLVPAPNSPEEVFGDDVSPLYLFWWDPDQGKYIRPTSIDPGRGYWLLLFGTTEIDVTGTAWTEDYEVQLGKAGWHMISTPTINVFWGYCKFRVGNVTKTLSEAVEAEWILPFFWQYDTTTGQYVALGANPQDVLRPWVGYWIKTLVDNVTVILPIKYMLTNPPVPPAGLALLGVGLPQETPPAPPSFAALAKDLLTVLAYPNPATANVVTFRALGLPVEGIRVSVFDLGGRKVWAGEAAGHELAWNLADSSGQPLANGVYLYVVEARLSGQWVSMGLNRLLILR